MPEDPTIKLTDFDCIVGDHHLQMLKAALPYLQVSQQRFLSFSIKFQELQHTMSLLHNEDNAALGDLLSSRGGSSFYVRYAGSHQALWKHR